MLFGAAITKRPDENYRLRVQRSKKRWPSLGFLLIVAESQDLAEKPEGFDFLTFNVAAVKGDHLVGMTRSSRFLGAAYTRWYPRGVLTMPDDVSFDEAALVFWLLGNWSDTGPVTVPSLGGNFSGTQDLESVTHMDHVEFLNRPAVEAWLRERVPEKVWRLRV